VSRHAFRSARVPPPDGACSAGVTFGNLIAVSAQLPVDAGGALVEGGAAEQAGAALENLRRHFVSIGLSLDHVVSLRVYLVDPEDAVAVDAAIATVFATPFPALTIVGVAWIPGGARLQVEALAARH
jgi:enamine deaminase RidA (YjgF/YER057c/UK114 family)